MRYIELGHFLVVLYHFIVTIYLAKLLFIYFCHLSTCVRWAWLNKNRKQNMRTKRRTGKKQKTKKKRSINLIYLLRKPNRCARWRVGGGYYNHVCVCVCACDIVLARHLQAAQSQRAKPGCGGRGCCCR